MQNKFLYIILLCSFVIFNLLLFYMIDNVRTYIDENEVILEMIKEYNENMMNINNGNTVMILEEMNKRNEKREYIEQNCDCFDSNKTTILFSDYRTGSTNIVNVLNKCKDNEFKYELFGDLPFKTYEEMEDFLLKNIEKKNSYKIQANVFYKKYKWFDYFLEKHKKDIDINLLILERNEKLKQFISKKIMKDDQNKKDHPDSKIRIHYETQQQKMKINYDFDRTEYMEFIEYQTLYYNDLIDFLYSYKDFFCTSHLTYESYFSNYKICNNKMTCKSSIIG